MAKRGQPDDPGPTDDSEAGAHGWNAESMTEALREAGRRAVELSNNPAARALFAAGLAAAAAAIASNKNVRDATKRNIKEAQEATGAAFESAAENASKIGTAIVNSAIDAVQSLMKGGTGAAAPEARPQAAASTPAPAPKPARTRKAPAKTSTAKTSTAKTSTAKTTTAKTAAAKAPATTKAPAKPRTAKPKSATAAKPRTRTRKTDGAG